MQRKSHRNSFFLYYTCTLHNLLPLSVWRRVGSSIERLKQTLSTQVWSRKKYCYGNTGCSVARLYTHRSIHVQLKLALIGFRITCFSSVSSSAESLVVKQPSYERRINSDHHEGGLRCDLPNGHVQESICITCRHTDNFSVDITNRNYPNLAWNHVETIQWEELLMTLVQTVCTNQSLYLTSPNHPA